MLISVVVPCYNEEAVIGETHARLTFVLSRLEDAAYEIIYIDDGSQDQTPELLQQLQSGDACVRVLRFSRNFGHQLALTAGLEHATGSAVVVIDADLQDPPEIIPEMLARWRDGYEVVYGMRTDRPGESSFKLWTAKIFYRLMNRLSETKMPLDAGDFRLMDRKVLDVLRAMPERDRFLRGMVSWVGFRQVAILYARAPRAAGVGKYPFWKMMRFAADGVLSFSLMPLRLAVLTGFLAIAMALLGIIYAVLLRLYTTDWVRGWASIFVAVLFMGGVQLVSLGIIGEYIGRIYGEVKHRPLYLLRDKLGFEAEQIIETEQTIKAEQRESPQQAAELKD
ncbi:MAG TPA: glycosyltransferase family 2 protein [Pyrinomonadaceae bacterium]